MSKQNSIKNTYADALYWAMSPKSKDKPYHLTRTEESVFRKLTRYDKKNPKITYSNELIAEHTFLDITTIEKAIPSLNKKQWIKTINFQINDGSGKITSRRIININWEFVAQVLSEVPQMNRAMLEEELNAQDETTSSAKLSEESEAQVDSEPTILKLRFDTNIEADENIGKVFFKQIQRGEKLEFIDAIIEYSKGMVESDEVVMFDEEECIYFRKSQLKRMFPEHF